MLAKDILALPGEQLPDEVEAAGWVHRIREFGGMAFIILRDRSALIQLIFSKELLEELSPTLESVIQIRGKPVLNDKAPGGLELEVFAATMQSRAATDLPYQVNADPSRFSLDAILANRVLSLRNPKIRAIFQVQATILEAYAAYLRSEGFTEIKTSKLVGASNEGGTELFSVDYFDRKVYLAQSPQTYKQTMIASGLERVFEVAPAYRAEKHDTPRHLNEYISLDVEMAFIESEIELINLEKRVLSHIFAEVARNNAEELALWNATVPEREAVMAAPIVPYDEALEIANQEAAKAGSARLFDINPEAERILCAWADAAHGIPLIFVNQFPRRHRPFYTYPLGASQEEAALTMSFDALFRGLEITTGGRRQHDYNALLEALPRFGIKSESMTSYLTVFKYGCPPHGGFAIGCERLTQKILGLANIKEASLFPRDRKRVEP